MAWVPMFMAPMPQGPAREGPESWEAGVDRVELYTDESGEWRWRRVAPNGEVVADSGEGYVRRIDALREAQRVNAGLEVGTPAPEVEE